MLTSPCNCTSRLGSVLICRPLFGLVRMPFTQYIFPLNGPFNKGLTAVIVPITAFSRR